MDSAIFFFLLYTDIYLNKNKILLNTSLMPEFIPHYKDQQQLQMVTD